MKAFHTQVFDKVGDILCAGLKPMFPEQDYIVLARDEKGGVYVDVRTLTDEAAANLRVSNVLVAGVNSIREVSKVEQKKGNHAIQLSKGWIENSVTQLTGQTGQVF